MKNVSSEKTRVKFPIGVKLAVIIGLVVLISLGTVTFLNSYFIGQDVRITAENNNLTMNMRAASTVEDKLSAVRSSVFQLLDLINVASGGRNSAVSRQTQAFFFERNHDIAAVLLLAPKEDRVSASAEMRIVNTRFFLQNEIDSGVVNTLVDSCQEIIRRSVAGETIAENVSPYLGIPSMALFFPWKEQGRDQTCAIVFSIETISDILGSDSVNTTYLVNDSDDLLSHPDTERILARQNLSNDPFVSQMRRDGADGVDGRQILFSVVGEDGGETEYFGAWRKLSFGDIATVTTVPLDSVLEAVRTTRKNNILLTIVVFFLSIMIVLLYARFGISRHLRKLTIAADEIQRGNFDTDIITELKTDRSDEIGVLNRSTQDEREFLNTFAKFTNRNVAKAVARKEIDFAPHLKDVTIFFSDIRGFTAISDSFKKRFGDDSPKEIISFLNDYMERMVACITLSGGNVDKFEGDAIMALWGIMRDDSFEWEHLPDSDAEKARLKAAHMVHVREDAVNAIRGTVAMRYALMEYNKAARLLSERADGGSGSWKPHIQIGCGINTGRATVGIMGSEDKMEYTAIGDAVNFASRTESSNKPCGTDILISEDTYNLLKDGYIRNEGNGFSIPDENRADEIVVERIPVEFDVKGKGAQHFYGVVNMPNFDIERFFRAGNPGFVLDAECATAIGPAGPKTLNEVRALLGIPIPEFGKVNLNEEENKIQVKG